MKNLLQFLIFVFIDSLIVCEPAQLQLKYQEVVILNYNAEFNGAEIYKSGRFEFLNLWGKICLASNFSIFESECRNAYKPYNSRWVVPL